MTHIILSFKTRDGGIVPVQAEIGRSLMWVAHAAGLEVEGACEGNLACATCHMILSAEAYRALPRASEEEEDMLDLAQDLRPTSRLGCQIVVNADMDGWLIELPRETQNLMGF